MASVSLADQLDDAIEMMLAEPDSAPPKVDLKIGDLLGIAAELRLMPDPKFRAALRAKVVGQPVAVLSSAKLRTQVAPAVQPRQDANQEAILPSLFGAGYGTYPVHRGNFMISLVAHAAAIALMATAGLWVSQTAKQARHVNVMTLADTSPYPLPPAAHKSAGGGGGGARDKMAESNGRLPRFAREQLTPPALVVRNGEPRLSAEPTVIGPPALTIPTTAQIGNPLSAVLQPPSSGTGFGGGMGTGSGGGIGSGYGPGVGPGYGGGIGGGVYRVGGGVTAPHAIYDPDPEYSEEARKAKYQGTVLLWVVIGPNGRPRDIRVQRSLGLGLDEKAIEAVRKWKFEPAMKDGHPVAVEVNIEVSFRLY